MIHIQRTSQREWIFYFVIVLTGTVVWLNPDTFLWRDDWLYLLLYQNSTHALFNGNGASDIKPLFQYLLFSEFYCFGTHFPYYQLINVFLLAANALLMYQILKAFNIDIVIAGLGSFVFLLHPTNFVNAFWIFGQCELVHLSLLLICILSFKRYLDQPSLYYASVYALSLFLQNYFFPNGIFLPLMFLLIWVFHNGVRGMNKRFLLINLVVLILNIVHAAYIQAHLKETSIQTAGLLSSIPDKIGFFFLLIANSIWRMFIPNFGLTGAILIDILPFLILFVLLAIYFKQNKQRNLLLLGALGLLFSSVILAVTRYQLKVIPYYYTSLHLPYLVILLAVFSNSFAPHFVRRKATGIFVLFSLIGLILLDFKGKKIFAERNRSNQTQMEFALQNSSDFDPTDDPALDIEHYISLQDATSYKTAVILYRNLESK